MADNIFLVIPAYCESLRLAESLAPLLSAIAESALPIQILVMDDGSPETERLAMGKICDDLRAAWPALLPMRSLPQNTGKGGAIVAGWSHAPATGWLGFCDADGSVPPAEVIRLARLLHAGSSRRTCLIASRQGRRGGMVTDRTWLRWQLGRIFGLWVRLHTGLRLQDTQCGCKFLPAVAWHTVASRISEMRFAFDVELLLLLARHGCPIREEPVLWRHHDGGHVRLLRDGASMFTAVRRMNRHQQNNPALAMIH